MSFLQLSAIIFMFLAPLVLWRLGRRLQSTRFDRNGRRVLAVLLLLLYASDLTLKCATGEGTLAAALPMQLCDWVLFAIVAALWWRWRLGFELGYFWGLGGTIQALFTPAIEPDLPWWRAFGFFFSHALIVAGVLHLLLSGGLRPRPPSLVRVFIWSELYLAIALLVNAGTGANYGFLSHKPAQASMLDLFSDHRGLYVLQINLTALLFFCALYVPWLIYDSSKARPSITQRPA